VTVRAILFDFGGTLDQPVHWLDRFVAHYRAFGLSLNREELDPAFDRATEEAYRATEKMREMGLRETVDFLLERQLEQLGCLGPEHVRRRLEQLGTAGVERLRDRVGAAFAEESRCGMVRSRTLLQTLKPRFQLGVVSNFYGNLDRVLAEAGMLELMETTVDSSSVGLFKPDSRIFQSALASLEGSVEPSEVAMVGDSAEKDCAAARRAGLKAIWLCNQPDRVGSSEIVSGFADHKIHALDELLQLEWPEI
jgi:putative hydrolase of the HAD superfamily